jgi:hypothetical protein
MDLGSLLAYAIWAVILFLLYGFTVSAFIMIGCIGVLVAIANYFETRDHSEPPSTFERVFAYIWVWVRRAVCWPVGGFILYKGVQSLIPAEVQGDATPWWMSLSAVLFGAFLIYIGFVGQGNTRSALQDDLELHRANKRRYKLWF